jgi:hypothetical protein
MGPDGNINRFEEIAAILTDNTNLSANPEYSHMTFSEALGVIQAGSWYTLPEELVGKETRFQGSDKIIPLLENDPELVERLEKEIYKRLTRVGSLPTLGEG